MEPVSDPRIYSNRYQVTHLIARGGMALVYRAQDLLLNRAVALKILYPELSADSSFVERFRREAQAAANLSHPNIVPVFDWGEDEGTYFIVMELIDGTSLAEMLRGSRTLTPARSAAIVAQVAGALGYAHRSGVVHRDVKPGNILITSEGEVKVTDFGIAQAVSSEDHLAEAGSVMGTATYFSPEQAEGASVDGRSDVYSLGVVLYEMLVGRPPFIGDSPVAVSSQHVHGTVPPLSQFNATVPRDLEAIVMEALAKSPDRRYQSADEFRADLLRFSEGQPVRAAGHDVAFFGADATRAVAAVSAGERTQSVPMMSGPRTDVRRGKNNRSDVRRRENNRTGLIVAVVIVLLAAGALAYFLLAKSSGVTQMPNVVGRSVSVATKTLTADGLLIGVPKHVASTQKLNTVLLTDPKAGAKISKGQSVTLTLSLGKVLKVVKVPDTTTMSLIDADSALRKANLVPVTKLTSTAPASGAYPGTVVSQTPVGGSSAHAGDKVIITVLAPGSTFPMPSLVGDTQLHAASVIGQYGLTVGPITTSECSNTRASGLVVRTVPATGLPVHSGLQVRLVTSSGYCQVTVPLVTQDSLASATAKLTANNLVASVGSAPAAMCVTSIPGTVVSQTPVGGTSVPYNSTVDLLVCPQTVTTTVG